METLHLTFRLLAASQVGFLCLYLFIHQYLKHRDTLNLVLGLNLMAITCWLLIPVARSWHLGVGMHVIIFWASCIPSLLWLFGHKLFSDNPRIPSLFWPLTATYLILWLPNWVQAPSTTIDRVLFDLIPQLVKLGFVVHLLYMTVAGRSGDLVNERLKLRIPMAAGGGVLCAVVIIFELWLSGTSLMSIELFGSTIFVLLSFAANLYVFRLREDFPTLPQAQVQPQIETKEKEPTDFQSEIDAIEQQMADRLYATHGVTIGDLAGQINLPEYKLRTIINRQMGYRNFNQFLNFYRIKEASTRLLEQRELPILTIALDIGFKSLSSFNKAFKDIHEQTPSEFRAQQGK